MGKIIEVFVSNNSELSILYSIIKLSVLIYSMIINNVMMMSIEVPYKFLDKFDFLNQVSFTDFPCDIIISKYMVTKTKHIGHLGEYFC